MLRGRMTGKRRRRPQCGPCKVRIRGTPRCSQSQSVEAGEKAVDFTYEAAGETPERLTASASTLTLKVDDFKVEIFIKESLSTTRCESARVQREQ